MASIRSGHIHRDGFKASQQEPDSSFYADLKSTDNESAFDPPYVQGMNVLAAPFLYAMPSELEAFSCLTAFIEQQAPRYVQSNLDGVHAGLAVSRSGPRCDRYHGADAHRPPSLQLVDRCLAVLDPDLYSFLAAHGLQAEVYAFPAVMTFSASTPPLPEVLLLWDFLLAWGCGLNILCVVAQVILMRDALLQCASYVNLQSAESRRPFESAESKSESDAHLFLA